MKELYLLKYQSSELLRLDDSNLSNLRSFKLIVT